MKLMIGSDFLLQFLRAADHCQLAADLLLEIHDGRANLAGRHAGESSGQNGISRMGLALDNRQVIGIQNNHYRLRLVSERR
jgi:hypothetical protein